MGLWGNWLHLFLTKHCTAAHSGVIQLKTRDMIPLKGVTTRVEKGGVTDLTRLCGLNSHTQICRQQIQSAVIRNPFFVVQNGIARKRSQFFIPCRLRVRDARAFPV